MSVNSKMTAIADEIRELSGTIETMGLDAMATHIGDANTEVDNQADLLAQAVAALEGKAGGGEQATPVISISSNGLITATAGAKSSTHQLAFQAAKTITPSAASQIAVSSGYYTGGDITVAGDSNLVANNIVSGKTIFGVVGTATSGDDPFTPIPSFTYTVDAISGAQYGFAKNSNGYYESQNKGQDNSYAICRVNLTVTEACDIVFDVINYAESSWDYGLFGELNKALSLSSNADNNNVKHNFSGESSASVVNVTYDNVAVGTHFIDVKFIKDNSQSKNNDSIQFKLQEQRGALPPETINKILAADEDLVAENIKDGVSIFGIIGNYTGNDSEADSLITKNISTYTNNRVTTSGYGIFGYANRLQSVNFPNVTTIGSNAFYNCLNLTTISFPKVTDIGSSAFYQCQSLTTVSFPVATSIGSGAFQYCKSLTTVNFPAAISIGINAFCNCSSLSSLTADNFPVAKYICSNAFSSCSKLTTVSFPAVTIIGGSAFCNCSNLTTVSFPVATTISGNSAFYGCSNLTTVNFPEVTTIGNSTFGICSKLTTISFPVATSIGNYAFTSCSSLTTINFPAVTIIGYSAFGSCTKLTTASFPAVTSISDYAFYRCYNLTALYLTGSSICTLSNSYAFSSTPIGGYSRSAGTYGSIYVPASLLASYKAATNWTYFSSRFVAYDA